MELKEETDNVDLEYYDLHGGTHHIYLAPGNVQWICNILFNYEKVFDDFIEDPPVWAEEISGWKWKMQISRDRIHKIRMQVEKGLGYSTEAHWEKCLKKYGKKEKEEDVGGEALEMAFRRTVGNKNKPPQKPGVEDIKKVKNEPTQISIFDIVKENQE